MSAVMTAGPEPMPGFRAQPARKVLESAGYLLFALFIFFTCFTFLRPSPYDFAAIPAMLVWFVLGVRLHRSSLPFVALLLFYKVSLVAALVPYFAEPDPTLWTIQSLYLMVTAIFFVMFFAHQTERRVELTLKAYLASCIFAAGAGILSYFKDTGLLFVMDGRAAGVFQDPNVLGSFLVLGVLYLLRGLMTGDGRHPILATAGLLLLLAGVFLSFSRGAWAALVLGTAVMTFMTFRTNPLRVRRRIVALGLVGVGLATLLLLGLLSVGDVGERFADRARLTQSYDQGVTGRFGNQIRSIPMLIERPEGFGPLRFRLVFGLEPHNSYIGGFANGGWTGGLAFIGLVLVTIFVGFRLCLTASPYQRQAQIVFPAVLMFFLQALQIDIDHWRHVYIMLGMVWGLEAGRRRWLASRSAVPDPGQGAARSAALLPRAA
ncbi:O-antigen ligase family protein [Enterovirga aerilata]|uniref:O-antigen ligase family protein n=1 Tax=Enterovirga aerilata TaxID=2730920 RepID=UPI001581E59B|nr:O-antigen ligase family protein [Enterovirga sp. DB1703]